MTSSKRIAGLFAGLACLVGGGVAAADLPPLSHSLTPVRAQPAPAMRLVDVNGRQHDLAQLKGKVVLVNFWATWCPPCRREMPSMQRLADTFKDQPFVVLAVNVGETPETIELFTSQLDTALAFPILLDKTSQAMQAWKVAGLPTTYLVDKRGRIVATAIGGREFDHPEIVKSIRALIRR